MNVDKYIYSRPNKANRTDLHCTIDYWSEVEEQSVERTGKIGLIVVELWSCMSRSSQALAPHKHSLLTSTGFDDQKQMTLEGSQWPKNRWQCSQWPKNKCPWRVLDDCSFPSHRTEPEYSQNRNKNIHRTEPGYSNDRKLLKPGWRAGDDVAPTWWNCNRWMALLEPQWRHCNTTNPKQGWQYLNEFMSDVDGSCIKLTVLMRRIRLRWSRICSFKIRQVVDKKLLCNRF